MNLHHYYYKRYFSKDFLEKLENLRREISHLEEEKKRKSGKEQEIKEQIKAKKEEIDEVRNMTLHDYRLPQKIDDICKSMQPEANKTLEFEVSYPGLITGIGLPHETGTGENDEYKLGMHFDYTYGIPVIYGSSVKGVLHSYFQEYVGKLHIVQNGENKVLSYAKGESLTAEQQKKLEREIFGSNIDSSDDNDNMPVGNRDIFFDAIPVQAAPPVRVPIKDSQRIYPGSVLSDDYLCPHNENVFKDPIPIHFLRITPGVIIRFGFHLQDTCVDGICFSADAKIELYKKILTDVGIGAKTNVGYGRLKEAPNR